MPNILTNSALIPPSGAKLLAIDRSGAVGKIFNGSVHRGNNRTVIIGTSISKGASNTDANGNWTFFGTMTEVWAQQAGLELVCNAGLGGDTSGNMLSRFDSDVTPHYPGVVIIEPLTNDLPNFNASYSNVSTYLQNVSGLIEKTFAIGATPILVSPPPSDVSTAAAKNVQWHMYDIAQYYGISLLDPYRYMVDSTDGSFISGYASDGVHPTRTGITAALSAGANINNAPVRNVPYFAAVAETVRNNHANMLLNGNFANSSAPPTPTGWTVNTTGATQTLETPEIPYTGKTFKYVKSAAGGVYMLDGAYASLTAGRSYRLMLRLKISGMDLATGSGLSVMLSGGAYDLRPLRNFVSNGDFIVNYRFVADATASWFVKFYVSDAATYEVNNVTLVDETAMRAIYDPGYVSDPYA